MLLDLRLTAMKPMLHHGAWGGIVEARPRRRPHCCIWRAILMPI